MAQEIGSAQDTGDARIVAVRIDSEEAAAQVRQAGGSALHTTTPMEYFKLVRRGGDDVLFDYDCQSLLLEEIDDLTRKKVARLQRALQAA